MLFNTFHLRGGKWVWGGGRRRGEFRCYLMGGDFSSCVTKASEG